MYAGGDALPAGLHACMQVEIHEDFLQDCMDRLKAMYDTVSMLERGTEGKGARDVHTEQGKGARDVHAEQGKGARDVHAEAVRMIRVLSVLRVYISECDEAYVDERAILPLHRCVGRYPAPTQVQSTLSCPSTGM